MLHPSYAELMKVVNSEAESDMPMINSRYSIVLATAKRARQLIDGKKPLSHPAIDKPLSIAVDELSKGYIKIEPESETEEEDLVIDELGQEEETAQDELTQEKETAQDELTQEESAPEAETGTEPEEKEE